MAKRRIVRDSIFNENSVNTDFRNPSSSTIYTLGEFTLDTNLENRVVGDFSNKLSTFSKDYTLESIGIDVTTSQKIYDQNNKLKLNIDYNDIRSYSRYGSVEDLLKYSVINIIEKFPFSIYMNSELTNGIINTIIDFQYDSRSDQSTFKIPTISIVNNGNIILNSNNFVDNGLKNFNLSKNKYIIWDSNNPQNEYPIINFTGDVNFDNFITIIAKGKVFNLNNQTLSKNFHIKPNKNEYNLFLNDLNDIEKYILSNRVEEGFKFKLKNINKSTGNTFFDKSFVWPVTDGYNIEFNNSTYTTFLGELIELGYTYDLYKTDIIYRMYLTNSIKEFDLTGDAKLQKLIRSYGYNFDNFKRLIDGFATLNNITYKKEGSIPDILLKNLAKVLGWDVVNIVNDDDLMSSIFSIHTNNVNESLIPSEIDIELWRRILINTKWFFQSKGTRKSLETLFKLIGIPEDFITINEYVYLAEKNLTENEKRDSTSVSSSFDDTIVVNPPSYNTEGYPIAVTETNEFFFQISGNTDSGQAYINRFRENGFNIVDQQDNKKSWVYVENYHTRKDENTTYTTNDSRLVINTKEIDLGIDPSRSLLFDIYNFNKVNNNPICSNGVSLGVIYVNVLSTPDSLNIFEIPDIPDGDIQVVLNGLTLVEGADYTVTGDNNIITITKLGFNYIYDIVTITYVVNNTNNQVEYNIFKPTITSNGQTLITLPTEPSGDIQLVINGFTLNNSIDFYVNPNNRLQLILTNVNIKTTDILSVMYINELSENNTNKYSDNYIVTSYYTNKLFYNTYSNRYTYITDYVIPNSANIKVTLNGKTLTNNVDFSLNQSNKKQIVFSSKIKININDRINAFYLLENGENSDCIDIGIDINETSFFEYADKVYKNLINVRNRKIITNNKGGSYPTLSKVYDLYTKNNPNPKRVDLLYSFIKRFDNQFMRFADQLLPATAILRKGGLIVSNSIFGQQKYKYIRGINDGSEFVSESKLYDCTLFTVSDVTTTDATSSDDLGSFTITVSGDNTTIGPTEFSLNNVVWDEGITTSGSTSFTLNNLRPGTYEVFIRDGINCLLSEEINVLADCSLFTINDIIVEDKISTTELGSIEIIASGDTKIMYSIDGGVTYFNNNKFNDLEDGDYEVVVKNGIDCIVSGGTVTVNAACDIEITDIEVLNCVADGFESRLDSNLFYLNDKVTVFLSYDFIADANFKKYVRDRITITETTTNQVVLVKWVEFIVDENEDVVELGTVWEYSNVPTYADFNFSISYLDSPQISCEPFETELPVDVFNPITEVPNIIVMSINASPESCIGGGSNEYIGASVGLNVLAPFNIEVGLFITYTSTVGTAIGNIYIQIPAGQSFANVVGCEGGLYIPGLIGVDSVCIEYISDTNINLNGFGC